MGYHQAADTKFNKAKVVEQFIPQGLTFHKRHFTELLNDATKTLDVQDDGKIILCTVTTVVTLPAVGSTLGPYTLVNYGEDGEVQITVSPNENDKIYGPDITAADNKDIVNTLATAKKGDMIKLEYADATGWRIAELIGTWARQA